MVYRIPAATEVHYDRSVDDQKRCNYGSAQVMRIPHSLALGPNGKNLSISSLESLRRWHDVTRCRRNGGIHDASRAFGRGAMPALKASFALILGSGLRYGVRNTVCALAGAQIRTGDSEITWTRALYHTSSGSVSELDRIPHLHEATTCRMWTRQGPASGRWLISGRRGSEPMHQPPPKTWMAARRAFSIALI